MPRLDVTNPQKRKDNIQRILSGDFRAVARMLTLVENNSREAIPYLRALFPHTGRSFTIGITGAPGAGKSSLVDRLAEYYRRDQKKVGIIAVDPTSPFSGGAILGDRIRMQSRSHDPGTFIRSMATRGHMGGLTRTTADVLMVMDAAGFDWVLVETVGVGQDEVEIVKTADATLVLLVPGMGDDIQMMKAGIMEIGDIFVINKADHPGADRIERELQSMFSMSRRSDGWNPLIVRTIASEGEGISECIQAISKYRSFLEDSQHQSNEAIQIQKERLLEIVCSQTRNALLQDSVAGVRIQELARLIADRKLDPFSAAEELIRLQLNRKVYLPMEKSLSEKRKIPNGQGNSVKKQNKLQNS
jgi:LAO/AO transport system kinase